MRWSIHIGKMKKQSLLFSRHYADRIFVIVSVFALSLGGFIYILFRPSEHIFFDWIRSIGLGHWLNLIRENSISSNLLLPEWIVYSLPNGLWAFAYALLISIIWRESKSWIRYLWFISIPVLVIGYEVLQYASIIPGTFSMQDIGFGIGGLILGIILGIKTTKPYNHEETIE